MKIIAIVVSVPLVFMSGYCVGTTVTQPAHVSDPVDMAEVVEGLKSIEGLLTERSDATTQRVGHEDSLGGIERLLERIDSIETLIRSGIVMRAGVGRAEVREPFYRERDPLLVAEIIQEADQRGLDAVEAKHFCFRPWDVYETYGQPNSVKRQGNGDILWTYESQSGGKFHLLFRDGVVTNVAVLSGE